MGPLRADPITALVLPLSLYSRVLGTVRVTRTATLSNSDAELGVHFLQYMRTAGPIILVIVGFRTICDCAAAGPENKVHVPTEPGCVVGRSSRLTPMHMDTLRAATLSQIAWHSLKPAGMVAKTGNPVPSQLVVSCTYTYI